MAACLDSSVLDLETDFSGVDLDTCEHEQRTEIQGMFLDACNIQRINRPGQVQITLHQYFENMDKQRARFLLVFLSGTVQKGVLLFSTPPPFAFIRYALRGRDDGDTLGVDPKIGDALADTVPVVFSRWSSL